MNNDIPSVYSELDQLRKEVIHELIDRLEWVAVDEYWRPVFFDKQFNHYYFCVKFLYKRRYDTDFSSVEDIALLTELKEQFKTGERLLFATHTGYAINHF
ncbi:hypothetical protein [Commensalibacter nepenthis]|uniref:Uncharacterized protein n=1 Tax=Commensalibacter nepenthis TaxID=3043872 RepID=A0ABT6Q4D2_9PROT|nr:hypothetical protein [Commensalibacter sp. TBRC 10068]MDI2111732.1 hypothetical protein [Commensalibacter sp. TBRC 10068]